jgi:RecJ-like exonuclease
MRNSSQALLALRSRPPIFGDPNQIAAMKYLRDLDAARSGLAECECEPCKLCDGEGKFYGDVCQECGGTGTALYCRHFQGLGGAAVIEARAQYQKTFCSHYKRPL